MVTVKHIARDLNVLPREIRAMLRARFGKHDRQWLWNEKEAAKIKKWLAKSLGKEVKKQEQSSGGQE